MRNTVFQRAQCLALAIVFLCISAAPRAGEPTPTEPTAKQLADAKEAYAKHGAVYEPVINPETKQAAHVFWMPKSTTDADLKGVPDLPFRFGLYLENTRITDAGVKELKELKNLISLELGHTQVTDAAVKELKDLKNLASLELGYTQVTDAGMTDLKQLTNLAHLVLGNTKVTDAGLKQLKELKNLTDLDLGGAKITAAGLKELQSALPKCFIFQ